MDYGKANLKMNDFAKIIFRNAVIKEQNAKKMYLDLANKSKTERLKKLFTKIAEEEMYHERLFEKADLSTLKIVNNAPLERLRLIEPNKEEIYSTEGIEDINNALDYAIKEEENACSDYELLATFIDFGVVKDTLNEIAKQEIRHKELLQKVKLEFNNYDWNVIL